VKTLYLILFAALITLSSCQRKRTVLRDRAIDTVQTVLKRTLNDPESYQAISFGPLNPIYNDVLPGPVDSSKLHITGYTIQHDYRAKNEFGALMLYKQKFVLTRKLKYVEAVELETIDQ